MAFYRHERFIARPGAWIGNQLQRLGGAALTTCMVSAAWFGVVGEYPYKVPMGAVLILTYLAWELLTQYRDGYGKDWKDIADDVLVWSYGVIIVLWPLSEVERTSVTLAVNFEAFWFTIAAIGVHAVVGVSVRLWQLLKGGV